jgi:hypothetical protein
MIPIDFLAEDAVTFYRLQGELIEMYFRRLLNISKDASCVNDANPTALRKAQSIYKC